MLDRSLDARHSVHPLHVGGTWRRSGDIRPGDRVSVLGSDRATLLSPAVLAIDDGRPTQLVWTVEVDPFHTFFASGVLAHNKNI